MRRISVVAQWVGGIGLLVVLVVALSWFFSRLSSQPGGGSRTSSPIASLTPTKIPVVLPGTPDVTITPAILPPTSSPSLTPTPEMVMPLLGGDGQTHEVVLTIRNEGEPSGREGGENPDWLAWGAQAFDVAPDGSFWIADPSANPSRLLHYSKQGGLLEKISTGDLAVWLADIEVTASYIWILDGSSMPPKILQLGLDGSLITSYDLPPGLRPEDGLAGIALGERGELLVELAGGVTQFIDADGKVDVKPLDGYSSGGRVYKVVEPSIAGPSPTGTIMVGDISIEVKSTLDYIALTFAGLGPGGSFYVDVYEFSDTAEWDRVVHGYSVDGKLLGMARLPESSIYIGHPLAVGPDGAIYTMISNEDHSVEIQRLRFASRLPPLTTPTPTITPTPLTPLRPTWTITPVGASDLDIAHETLLAFFVFLHDGRYAEAAAMYGGDYEGLRDANPSVDPDDHAQLFENGCTINGLQCLLVANIVEARQVAPDEFQFVLEFMLDDGRLFVRGPCCGASEADMPSVWQFQYTVKIINGRFLVMELPVYVP